MQARRILWAILAIVCLGGCLGEDKLSSSQPGNSGSDVAQHLTFHIVPRAFPNDAQPPDATALTGLRYMNGADTLSCIAYTLGHQMLAQLTSVPAPAWFRQPGSVVNAISLYGDVVSAQDATSVVMSQADIEVLFRELYDGSPQFRTICHDSGMLFANDWERLNWDETFISAFTTLLENSDTLYDKIPLYAADVRFPSGGQTVRRDILLLYVGQAEFYVGYMGERTPAFSLASKDIVVINQGAVDAKVGELNDSAYDVSRLGYVKGGTANEQRQWWMNTASSCHEFGHLLSVLHHDDVDRSRVWREYCYCVMWKYALQGLDEFLPDCDVNHDCASLKSSAFAICPLCAPQIAFMRTPQGI